MTPHALLALLPLLALRAAAMPMPLRRMSTGTSNPVTAALGLDSLSSTTSDLLGSTVPDVASLGSLGGVQDLLSTSSSSDSDGDDGSDDGSDDDQGLDLLSGNSLLGTLTDVGHDVGSALGLNTTLHAVLDGTPLAFIASDLELLSPDNLICTKVAGSFISKVYDLGCVCLGKDGLRVDDVASVQNVAGLSAWVEAQVSDEQNGDWSDHVSDDRCARSASPSLMPPARSHLVTVVMGMVPAMGTGVVSMAMVMMALTVLEGTSASLMA